MAINFLTFTGVKAIVLYRNTLHKACTLVINLKYPSSYQESSQNNFFQKICMKKIKTWPLVFLMQGVQAFSQCIYLMKGTHSMAAVWLWSGETYNQHLKVTMYIRKRDCSILRANSFTTSLSSTLNKLFIFLYETERIRKHVYIFNFTNFRRLSLDRNKL